MRDIVGYEGLYAVTSCGKVWSYRSQKFLKLRKDRYGYYYVGLRRPGDKQRNFWIHRLVAETYIPNPDNLETVNHIDYNLEHNYINNLEWMSKEENSSKRRLKKVKCIETGQVFESCSEAAKSVNRCHNSMTKHLRGLTSHCAGFHWEYVD